MRGMDSTSPTTIDVFPLGPWSAECRVCDDGSGYDDEDVVRRWAAEHRCKGLLPCGCPRRLADEPGTFPHYAGCAVGDELEALEHGE